MARLFTVSCVSLFPYSIGRKGFRRSMEMAERAGFGGIQGLPLRGWEHLEKFPTDTILSIEDAWNYGTLSKGLMRTFKLADDPYPTLIDWALFGPKPHKALNTLRNLWPGASYISHDFGETLMEINPEASINHKPYLSYLPGLVWDTWHVRRPHRRNGTTIEDWDVLLEQLPSESIQLIHVHPSAEESFRLIKGSCGPELERMLEALQRKTANSNCPIVLEVTPALIGMSHAEHRLDRIRRVLNEYFI